MQEGDWILAVNGIDTSSMTKDEALTVIKAAIVNPSTFTFGRRRRSKGGGGGGEEEGSGLKEIGSSQPVTQPPLNGDADPLAGDGEDQQQPVSLPPAAARSSPPQHREDSLGITMPSGRRWRANRFDSDPLS